MTHWEAVEREQREAYRRAAETEQDAGGMPLLVSDFRMNIERLRQGGTDRTWARNTLMPPPTDRRRGGLSPNEFVALFEELWPR